MDLFVKSSTSQEVLKTIAGEPDARISLGFMGLGLRATKRVWGGGKRTESWGKRGFVCQSTEISGMDGTAQQCTWPVEIIIFKKKQSVSNCACRFFSGCSLS